MPTAARIDLTIHRMWAEPKLPIPVQRSAAEPGEATMAAGILSSTIGNTVMTKRLAEIVLVCLLISANPATATSKVADETGVRDTENRWSEAFVSGDTAVLDALLDSDYVSIGATGNARPKAEIISLAIAYAKAHPGEHAAPLSPSSAIRVIGNAAVVRHHNSSDTSVDVFFFRDGHWYAWYSQHTKLDH